MNGETWPKESQQLRNGASGQVRATLRSGGPALRPAIESAINKAMQQVDVHVLAAPRACRAAVANLVGVSCWGASSFDQGPLLLAYLSSVRMLAKAELPDPGEIVERLLGQCVELAKQTEGVAFVHSVNGTNPVTFLAGLLDFHVSEFLEWWPLEHAEWAEAELARIGEQLGFVNRENEPT